MLPCMPCETLKSDKTKYFMYYTHLIKKSEINMKNKMTLKQPSPNRRQYKTVLRLSF